MKRRTIHGTSLTASQICLGTANFGVKGPETARQVYDAFRSAGGNFFDCAHIYACWRDELGVPERLLGEFIRAEKRGDLVLATKGGHPAFKNYPKPDAYLSAAPIRSDIDESRERLGIETLDLFYLHRDDPRMSADEIVDIVAEEVVRGAVRYVGASNWTIARIAAANAYAQRAGKPSLVISQPMWNLGSVSKPGGDPAMVSLNDRAEDIAYHEATRLPVACYTPTAQGYFADSGRIPPRYDNQTNQARLARCRDLAHRLGRTSGQVALAWLMNHPFDVYPILGTQDVAHLEDALGAADIVLDESTRRWISGG